MSHTPFSISSCGIARSRRKKKGKGGKRDNSLGFEEGGRREEGEESRARNPRLVLFLFLFDLGKGIKGGVKEQLSDIQGVKGVLPSHFLARSVARRGHEGKKEGG